MTIVATIVITFLVGSLLVGIFMWVQHPIYRCTREEFVERIEQVLMGQSNENHWRLLTALSLYHDPVLAEYQNRLILLEEAHWLGESKPPYLLTREGLSELQQLHGELIADTQKKIA